MPELHSSGFTGASHALPSGRVLEGGTSGWRRRGPDLHTHTELYDVGDS